jgi:hypothetical protein
MSFPSGPQLIALAVAGDVAGVLARMAGPRADGFVTGATAIHRTRVVVDATGDLADGSCTYTWIARHAPVRGPCKHMPALRFAASASLPGTHPPE